jgi:acetyltransferase-like isoleucine patch superfamily enzyme
MTSRFSTLPKSALRLAKAYARSFLQLGLTLLGYVPSHAVRKAGLRICGAEIASDALVYHGLWIFAPWKLTIGSGSVVGDHAILDARAGITIGDNVNISTNAAIWTLQHDYQSPDFAGKEAPVRICDYAWLCFRSTILPGVTVGEGAVVAACAVVTKDVPPYTVVAGIPAKAIGTRNRDLRYNLVADCNYFRFI